MKRGIAVLLITAMAVTMAAGCGKKSEKDSTTNTGKKEKVVVSEFRNLSWSSVYVASEKGFFEEEGLDVEFAKYNDGPIAFQGMHAGDSQFCLLSQEPVLKAQQEGLQSSIVYSVLDSRLYGLVSDTQYKTVADLKGQAIFAGMPGSAPYSFVCSILREAGLDPEKDVTFVNMEYSASMAALEMGELAASYINIDNRVEMQKMDINILVDTANEADAKKYLKEDIFTGEMICATKKYVQEHSETVQKFLNAVQKGTDWIQEHDSAETAKVLAPLFEGMTEDVIAQKIDIIKPSYTKTGYISEESQKAVEDFCMESGVISKEVPYDDIIDMTFVDKMKK